MPDNLAALEKELEPIALIPTIQTYVLSTNHDYWALDADFDHEDTNRYTAARKRLEDKAFQLGQDFALSNHALEELGADLFSIGGMPYRAVFGRGLARGAHDLRIGWQRLVEQIEKQPDANKDFGVIGDSSKKLTLSIHHWHRSFSTNVRSILNFDRYWLACILGGSLQ